jgi:hypothetical protein
MNLLSNDSLVRCGPPDEMDTRGITRRCSFWKFIWPNTSRRTITSWRQAVFPHPTCPTYTDFATSKVPSTIRPNGLTDPHRVAQRDGRIDAKVQLVPPTTNAEAQLPPFVPRVSDDDRKPPRRHECSRPCRVWAAYPRALPGRRIGNGRPSDRTWTAGCRACPKSAWRADAIVRRCG